MDQATHTAINWLSTGQMRGLLERHSIETLYSTAKEVKRALKANVEDGEIKPWEIEALD